MSLRFWMKTGLTRVTPGGYGYARPLRRERDAQYVHERDQHPLRRKHHHAEGWHGEARDGLVHRDYATYEEYLTHQRLKFDEILKIRGGFSNAAMTGYRLKFYRRFRHLRTLLPGDAAILCAGARQGTEVEVLRDLGFRRAWGIDVNPGPGNPFVREGDFMRIDAPAGSIDLIYSNCVDHAFDVDKFFAEHARVLKPEGYALYDLPVAQARQPFEAIAWESEDAVLQRASGYFRRLVRSEREREWVWCLWHGAVGARAARA